MLAPAPPGAGLTPACMLSWAWCMGVVNLRRGFAFEQPTLTFGASASAPWRSKTRRPQHSCSPRSPQVPRCLTLLRQPCTFTCTCTGTLWQQQCSDAMQRVRVCQRTRRPEQDWLDHISCCSVSRCTWKPDLPVLALQMSHAPPCLQDCTFLLISAVILYGQHHSAFLRLSLFGRLMHCWARGRGCLCLFTSSFKVPSRG